MTSGWSCGDLPSMHDSSDCSVGVASLSWMDRLSLARERLRRPAAVVSESSLVGAVQDGAGQDGAVQVGVVLEQAGAGIGQRAMDGAVQSSVASVSGVSDGWGGLHVHNSGSWANSTLQGDSPTAEGSPSPQAGGPRHTPALTAGPSQFSKFRVLGREIGLGESI